jgi:hypothetical protein
MVLEHAGAGYRVRGDISISRPPIAVLPTRTHGWRDISVFVAGGGILPGYSAVLPFDGEQYPENPSVPPARPLGPKVKLRNLIAGSGARSGVRVFPASAGSAPPTDLPEGQVEVTGHRVEVRMPSAGCWEWTALTTAPGAGLLVYKTGGPRRDASGRVWQAWVFDATGPGEATIDFGLIPGWRFIYPDEARRAAAAKIWTAKVVVP